MVRIAAHEHEPVVDPVGDPEAHHLGVEVGGRLHVGNREGDVAELERPDAVHLMVRAEIVPFREQVDGRALVVLEGQHPAHAGHGVVAQLAVDAVGRERLGELAEIGIRRDLEGEPGAARLVGLLELDHQQPGLGRQEGAVLLALGEDEPGDVRPIGDLLLDVGRLEGRVADASGLDHDYLRTGIRLSAAGDHSPPVSAPPYQRPGMRTPPCQGKRIWRKVRAQSRIEPNGRQRAWPATS